MPKMDGDRMAQVLNGPLQGVLSVSRPDGGPVAVPISHRFGDDASFYMITSPDSVHDRLLARTGRATMTVQFEDCDGQSVHQWYVMAEGPIRFTDLETRSLAQTILAKDCGPDRLDDWAAAHPGPDMRVAVSSPSASPATNSATRSTASQSGTAGSGRAGPRLP